MPKSKEFNKEFFSSGVYQDYQGLLNEWVGPVARRIYKVLQQKPKAKILDVGCGFGDLMAELQNKYHFAVEGLEYSAYAISQVKTDIRKQIRKGSILHLPFKKNSFDAVICFDVIYYFNLEETIKAIENLVNISRDYIFFNSAYRHSIWASQKYNPDPLRRAILSKKEYIDIFSRNKAKLVKEFYGENGGNILVFKNLLR